MGCLIKKVASSWFFYFGSRSKSDFWSDQRLLLAIECSTYSFVFD